ncbi:MAG TPA: Rid family detoxifying hydrolase [Gemmatimonadales bacterium]|nr:Rid family detoxifying hydrolase [Gemmatimonadales bacterium]
MRILVISILSLAAASVPALAQDRQVLHGPGEVSGLPFSMAVRVGKMLYLSGQIGNKPGTRELADTGIAGQTRQALENIKTVLASAGSSLDRAVKCTVFLADIKDYAAMNAVYATFFRKDPPARSTVAGSGLALGARVEIECMAVAGS